MTGRFGGELVTVALPGGCQCPGTPHEQDEVYLLPRLTFDGGAAAESTLNRHLGPDMDQDALARDLSAAYLEHQVSGWNLVGEDGMGLPFSPSTLMSDWSAARVVADKADDLYSEALLAPLREAVSTSSRVGPTAPSTSARTRSASTRRKRSEPSTTGTTPHRP